MAVDSVYQNLYVINQGNSSVVHFAVAGNGVLTQKDSITASSLPTALAVNTAGTYLYVLSGPNPTVLTAYSLASGAIGYEQRHGPTGDVGRPLAPCLRDRIQRQLGREERKLVSGYGGGELDVLLDDVAAARGHAL